MSRAAVTAAMITCALGAGAWGVFAARASEATTDAATPSRLQLAQSTSYTPLTTSPFVPSKPAAPAPGSTTVLQMQSPSIAAPPPEAPNGAARAVVGIAPARPAAVAPPPAAASARPAAPVASLPAAAPAPAAQQTAYAPPPQPDPNARRGIMDLQRFARTRTATAADGAALRLTEINPNVNSWFILTRSGAAGGAVHLENPLPLTQKVELAEGGLALEIGGKRILCSLNAGADVFSKPESPYEPVCGGHLWLRTQRPGLKTGQESAVEALRGLGEVGEGVISLYKTTVGRDAGMEGAYRGQQPGLTAGPRVGDPGPAPALTMKGTAEPPVGRDRLGIALADDHGEALVPGQWRAAAAHPGVHVSLMAPGRVAPEVMRSYPERVNVLDAIESSALVYLMAFDLDLYELNFHLGADHPALGWSSRPKGPREVAAGPDGFGAAAPFARVGMVAPYEAERLVALITGGFKREHGAFKAGPLSQVNAGSHYGFIEGGAMLSRLIEGLSTVVTHTDGTVDMKVWGLEDNHRLMDIRSARQNGVPLIELDPATGKGIPGQYVNDWGVGNWSGSASGQLRSMRSGACLQNVGGKKRLIFGVFTAATPSALARVFQAYQCEHAVHLDMNSPEHVYAALYRGTAGNLAAEHLNRAMAGSDPQGKPRYVASNDNRDFFAVVKRQTPPRR